MALRIIDTANRMKHTDLYRPFLKKYFADDEFPYQQGTYLPSWDTTVMRIANIGVNNDKFSSYVSFIITNKGQFDQLIAGKIPEERVAPYPEGGNEPGYLFWTCLILENRSDGIYLLHHAFKELEKVIKDWKINIKFVFAIAYTPISYRLMKRYKFRQVGTYCGKYPIMSIEVTQSPAFKALIPYIKMDSSAPWPGKPDYEIPDIDKPCPYYASERDKKRNL